GEEGLRDIADILGRPTAGAQAIAGQLTAQSRSDDYDDDTSVVVAEVTELREVREAVQRPSLLEDPPPRGASWAGLVAAAIAGAALLAGGFLMGRASRPIRSPAETARLPPSPAAPEFAGNVRGLPGGSVILVDDLNRRAYMLQVGAPAALPEKGT